MVLYKLTQLAREHKKLNGIELVDKENELIMLEQSEHISSTRTGLIVCLLVYSLSFVFFACSQGMTVSASSPQFVIKTEEKKDVVFDFVDCDGDLLEAEIRMFENFAASELHGEKAISCGICLASFKKTSMVTSLMCDSRHIFHAKCLLPWLQEKTKPTCPTCRSPIEKRDN